jgi:hypothetical protein
VSYQDLEVFKNQLFAEMKDMSYRDRFETAIDGSSEILWSKGPSYSIIPFELEMSGVAPSVTTSKEPSAKKNAQKLYLCNGKVSSIEYFNAHGVVHEVETFFYSENRCVSVKTNNHGEDLWLKMSELEMGKTARAGRVDFDSEFWTFRYDWEESTVREITTFCSNSLPGVVIYPEYDDAKLKRLYFLNEGKPVDVFEG